MRRRRMRPIPAPSCSAATITMALSCLSRPITFVSSAPQYVSSTSTVPPSRSRPGRTIAREFAVAESAKRGADRIAFNQMFKWVKSNAKREKINAIFAHKLDRVCRNMRDAVRLQELEDTCGVQLTFAETKLQIERLDRGRAEQAEIALKVFELSQTLKEKWVGADYRAKRRLLEIVCLNFRLDDVSLVPTIRKPFDVLAEGLDSDQNRGDRI